MTNKTPDFVHLHVHTQYSLLDGAIRIDDLLNRAKEFNMNSVAITDHGTMFGTVDFYEKANKAGIKPIIGCECYLAPRSLKDKTPQDAKGLSHLILLAENQEGYKNLCKLVSVAQLEGFYYKPRIDREILREFSTGLIALSACLHGEIPTLIRRDRIDEADDAARMYLDIFGEGNFFLEVQNNGIDIQEKVNTGLLEMSERLSIGLVASNDCHYLNKEDVRAHDVLLCIQTGKTVHDFDRLKFRTDQLYFKSKEELLDCLSEELTKNIKHKIEAVINDPNLNAIEKLNKMYYESGSYKVENIEFIMAITDALYNDDNLLLRHKFHNKSTEDFLPLMAAIFQQGKEEGVFEIDNPVIMARTILLFGMSIAEYNAKLLLQLNEYPEKLNELYDHFYIYQSSVERMLGAPKDSVIAFDKKFFAAFGKFLKDSK